MVRAPALLNMRGEHGDVLAVGEQAGDRGGDVGDRDDDADERGGEQREAAEVAEAVARHHVGAAVGQRQQHGLDVERREQQQQQVEADLDQRGRVADPGDQEHARRVVGRGQRVRPDQVEALAPGEARPRSFAFLGAHALPCDLCPAVTIVTTRRRRRDTERCR
jgi:hypothetical protein